ncbi:GTP 3',8-cyclase MoaA [Clostridium sporogenes]|uniref:GTP 3',8-cyclase n=1 Tax=Clostridium botulinum TaxID=1491 RepID=A0A6M0SYA2_CLOBO|nr:GTP 3',8-cyclase MoaA [Clostridium sporogenes]NFA59680.1 GTP 3',8-cyclase MoaA [Clostridium botulinum]NFI73189.1 GTP 3',8-cyclase MoaA [Clostridium sporogenes]NFL74083.1 GTP 3',8-cyclase MoaA [Clostridium sporogenes]NFM24748.1 GTP 3',8-cyclase MoaA [Clostridium sporogenes]NFP60601.1 GTP 3',8-cyclase MoaA [Clostridium sporogenes]
MLDKYGRKINYLRVSVTDRCNLRCIYCMPSEGVLKKDHDDIMRYEEIFNVVKTASLLGMDKIRFTGGEPLILKNIDNLIYNTSQLSSIKDIAMTTNAIFLEDRIDDLKKAGLKRVNISLDSLKKDKFKSITRGGDINKIFKGIEKSLLLGMTPIKINTVIMKGINDDEIDDFMNLTKEYPISVRFIELMPIGEGRKLYKDSYISSEEIISKHRDFIPVKRDKSSTAILYKFKEAKENIGFISPMSCKFCSGCNRVRLTSEGTLKPCLHSEKEVNLKDYVENEQALLSKMNEAIYNKPLEHHMIEEKESKSKKMMYQIGG